MMRKLATFSIIFAILIGLTFSLSACDEASQKSFFGFLYYEDELYGDSIEYYSEAIRLNPDRATPYVGRGHAYYATGRYKEAIEDYTKAIELDDTINEAYFWRGRIYRRLDNPEKALADYNKAIRLDPDNADYHSSRALLYNYYERVLDLDKAKKDYLRACELGDSDSCSILRSKAEEEILHGDSIKHYSKAIRLDPDRPLLYLGRGNSYYATGRYKEAIEDYTKAIELDKTLNEAYYWRGRCNQHFDNPEKALADYNEAIKLDPDNADYYSSRARVYLYYEKVHNRDKANEDYLKACELGDSDACSSVSFMSLGENEE